MNRVLKNGELLATIALLMFAFVMPATAQQERARTATSRPFGHVDVAD